MGNEYKKDSHAMAWLVAHEIGHNLGMEHDHDKDIHNGYGVGGDGKYKGCEHQDHVMSYEDSPCIWSDCSVIDFIDHYNRFTPQNWCMPELKKEEVAEVCMGKRELVRRLGKRELVDEELSSTSSIEEQLAWLLEEF